MADNFVMAGSRCKKKRATRERCHHLPTARPDDFAAGDEITWGEGNPFFSHTQKTGRERIRENAERFREEQEVQHEIEKAKAIQRHFRSHLQRRKSSKAAVGATASGAKRMSVASQLASSQQSLLEKIGDYSSEIELLRNYSEETSEKNLKQPPRIVDLLVVSANVPEARWLADCSLQTPSIVVVRLDEGLSLSGILSILKREVTGKNLRAKSLALYVTGGPGHLYLGSRKVHTSPKLERDEELQLFWRSMRLCFSKVQDNLGLIILGTNVASNEAGQKLLDDILSIIGLGSKLSWANPHAVEQQGVIRKFFNSEAFATWQEHVLAKKKEDARVKLELHQAMR